MTISAYRLASDLNEFPVYHVIFFAREFNELMDAVKSLENEGPFAIMLCIADTRRFLIVVGGKVLFDNFAT